MVNKGKAKRDPVLVLVQTRIPQNAADKMREKISSQGFLSDASYLRNLVLKDLGILD